MQSHINQLESDNLSLQQENQKLNELKKKLQDDHRVVLQKTRADLREAIEDKKVRLLLCLES
jgi:cell division protein FtsB